MSFSNGGGGTLTLPSPTHVRHVDVTSAVRSIRRSLSRSPSKFRLVTKSPNSSPKSPLSPSPLSPQKRAGSQPNTTSTTPHTPSPLAVPYPPSARLALRSSRIKSAPPRGTARLRTSPKSPAKRTLTQAYNSGNVPPASMLGYVGGQENSAATSPAERERKSMERNSKMTFTMDVPTPINQALSRLGGEGVNDGHVGPSTSSPLKRSDAIMNLDQASLGSPVAKRRSLHGSAIFGQDFNIMDLGASHFEIHDETNHEYELSTASITLDNSIISMPRRSSSLRKSTLQQRHGEKTSWGRRLAAQQIAAQQAAQTAPEISTPITSRNRPRVAADQFQPPHGNPFSSQGNLPNASIHVMNNPPAHQPHPLSRTITTSSSSSSSLMGDASPTRIPVNFDENPRPKLDFSKSLPAGALRPFAFDAPSDGGSFETPQNYRQMKPNPTAFASTGLISKVNRNPELTQLARGKTKNVPDTPCKKYVPGAFATYPAPLAGGLTGARRLRHSFGTPSTPFNPHGTRSIQNVFGRSTGVFGSTFGGLNRRGSFVSVDDDSDASPDPKNDSQSSLDFDLPPTPTKQALPHLQNGSPSDHKSFPTSMAAKGFSKRLPRTSSKLSAFSTCAADLGEDDSDGSMDIGDSPTTAHTRAFPRMNTLHSQSRSRTQQAFPEDPPSPCFPKSLTTNSLPNPSDPNLAKSSCAAPANQLKRLDFFDASTPRTPQDSMVPPDPSGLTISNPRDGQNARSVNNFTPCAAPATPTTGRGDYFTTLEKAQLSTTPISGNAAGDIDTALTSRFEKVEMVGSGEFSFVYRVSQNIVPFNLASPSTSDAISPFQARTPPTPMAPQVFAVKKSRQPYHGFKDRQLKLQEVHVLDALRESEHIVHLVDHWESNNHLYIQTEFCEEGSLDVFLLQTGSKGRLDDFRIWKILLELSLGLKHIHDSGFIHLDIKPANVLITFEGVLKIADFGMATQWPAREGIDGEGDREYMGPEVLRGEFDKPADIFALGLMLLEIAANVTLPENGDSWTRLRSGDLSDVPSLTWSTASSIQRDATGVPVKDSDVAMEGYSEDELEMAGFESPTLGARKRNCATSTRGLSHDPSNLFGSSRRGELRQAPAFMREEGHPEALDRLVRWMISPTPSDRPTVHSILETGGIEWVGARRRAGATVYEGNWGPADDVLADDAEMMDV